MKECSDSVVKCSTWDCVFSCWSLIIVIVLSFWAWHFILCLLLVKSRKRPDMTDKHADWDVQHQHKQIKVELWKRVPGNDRYHIKQIHLIWQAYWCAISCSMSRWFVVGALISMLWYELVQYRPFISLYIIKWINLNTILATSMVIIPVNVLFELSEVRAKRNLWRIINISGWGLNTKIKRSHN